jgi:hypothetical protein
VSSCRTDFKRAHRNHARTATPAGALSFRFGIRLLLLISHSRNAAAVITRASTATSAETECDTCHGHNGPVPMNHRLAVNVFYVQALAQQLGDWLKWCGVRHGCLLYIGSSQTSDEMMRQDLREQRR